MTSPVKPKIDPYTMKAGFVAIVGRPNAGKSTLLNQVLGMELSIVSPKPQTTRDRLNGILSDPEKGQMVFVDTPGLHKAKPGGINAYMVEEAAEALEGPDLVWYVVDPNSSPQHEQVVIDEILKKAPKTRLFIIFNKMDLKKRMPWTALFLDHVAACGLKAEQVFDVSAMKGKGVSLLLEASWAVLPIHPAYFSMDAETVSDRPIRYFVSEKIREQLFLHLGDELPYSCAVEVVEYKEGKDLHRVEACIYVERESQKGMVIGQGGSKIKAIGSSARLEIEQLIGSKAFLGLKVKVRPDWSRDATGLEKLGYTHRV